MRKPADKEPITPLYAKALGNGKRCPVDFHVGYQIFGNQHQVYFRISWSHVRGRYTAEYISESGRKLYVDEHIRAELITQIANDWNVHEVVGITTEILEPDYRPSALLEPTQVPKKPTQ